MLLFQPAGPPRVRVPFRPYFVSQVQAGAAASITSKGDTIQGTFKTSIRYPATDKRAVPTTLFASEVPTFWNNNQLTALLQSRRVRSTRPRRRQSASLLASLLLGFGPTL